MDVDETLSQALEREIDEASQVRELPEAPPPVKRLRGANLLLGYERIANKPFAYKL